MLVDVVFITVYYALVRPTPLAPPTSLHCSDRLQLLHIRLTVDCRANHIDY